jgi:hypothetical protein
MKTTPLVLTALVAARAGEAFAQPAPEPPTLKLPVGAHVRVRPVAAPGDWVHGTLVGADSGGIGFLPENVPPIPGSELRLPRETVARLEIATGRKNQSLRGLILGVAAGVAMGFAFAVDAERCRYDDNYFCSRGGAVAAGGLVLGGIGASVGALVKTETWMPVALDALGPHTGTLGGVRPAVRASADGLALGVSVLF